MGRVWVLVVVLLVAACGSGYVRPVGTPVPTYGDRLAEADGWGGEGVNYDELFGRAYSKCSGGGISKRQVFEIVRNTGELVGVVNDDIEFPNQFVMRMLLISNTSGSFWKSYSEACREFMEDLVKEMR